LHPASHAWLALADEFDRRDRIYGAVTTRRLAIFQQILADEAGQEPIPDDLDIFLSHYIK
jgi:hypothetical protein